MAAEPRPVPPRRPLPAVDRKSTRLNSSHSQISYAVFCLEKKLQPETIGGYSLRCESARFVTRRQSCLSCVPSHGRFLSASRADSLVPLSALLHGGALRSS